MADQIRVQLERGPKGKRVVAVAQGWPGLARGDKTEEAALDRLRSYLPRYAPVARRAGMGTAFAANTDIQIVERYPGTGSTDFWGISFAFSSFDQQPMSDADLNREIALMQASWLFFDDVRSRVSAEMQRGPRGGGKNREQIVRHTFAAQLDMANKLGIRTDLEPLLTDDGLRAHREAYCNAIRSLHSQGEPARKWPLRYLIRHTAFHTLDHAWEMEDKDLTAVDES